MPRPLRVVSRDADVSPSPGVPVQQPVPAPAGAAVSDPANAGTWGRSICACSGELAAAPATDVLRSAAGMDWGQKSLPGLERGLQGLSGLGEVAVASLALPPPSTSLCQHRVLTPKAP